MTDLLVKNAKIGKSNTDQYSVYNFGIPAYQSRTGLRTCPMAGKCATGCYATQGAYAWAPVQNAYEWRLEQTLRSDFADLMASALTPKLRTATRRNQVLVIRIHDSGDFYSPEYILKWFEVMGRFPTVRFYAYTKQVPLFQSLAKQGRIPSNLVLIYSEGGLADARIDLATERHSRVFPSLEALHAAGYADATENDLVACLGENHRIGLVFHGHKSTAWNTSEGAA